jgi:hypothetical protein
MNVLRVRSHYTSYLAQTKLQNRLYKDQTRQKNARMHENRSNDLLLDSRRSWTRIDIEYRAKRWSLRPGVEPGSPAR